MLFRKMLLFVLLLLAVFGLGYANRYRWRLVPEPPQKNSSFTLVWTFETPERGAIISTPLVAEDSVYTAAIADLGLSTFGTVYCLDRASGKVRWKFDDGGNMQHMYSSPCLDHGRLYIGEGMHQNFICKLYCLDAVTGKKLWHFETKNHIESTPCVDDGKVYFGAGDDGVYCVDGATGAKRWQFQGPYHIDSNPVIEGKHLFVGSGMSRTQKETKVFCLDIDSGKPIWAVSTDLPVWGSPVVAEDQLFVGLGNGRLLKKPELPEQPAGAVLCLDARSGEVIWRHDIGDAVFPRCAADKRRTYFGARDGSCYCLDRLDGSLTWSRDLGNPIVTSPALVDGRLYLIASSGPVCCLDSETGKPMWSFDIAKETRTRPQMLSSPVVVPGQDGGNLIFFGAELKNAVNSAAVLYCLRD